MKEEKKYYQLKEPKIYKQLVSYIQVIVLC